ncbi:MAG: magnesium transporter [Candidatus Gallionella acididurans]|uniref:Magnesium transporter n=1 Tax=Candidatus Gallionella acididurans TaxID=1796491 RepID=A0A139BRD0_9PROT|nr:MAG: magnesium transporter [Candidatus Gallionella acididurans]
MLINCVAYQNGVKLADLPVEEISDYLERKDCFVWVALRDATDGELDTMQEEFGLHNLAIEDARHGHQRPKIEEYGDTLFVVMHLVEVTHPDLEVGEISIFAGHNFILSVRNRSSRSLLGVRARCEREPDLLRLGSGFVLYALMDATVDLYFPVIDELESQLESIEEHLFDQGNALANIEQLYELKRKVMVLKHAVTPLMEATGKLHGGRVPPVCATTQNYFRDVYDHLTRINATIDAMRDTITTAILVSQSTVSIEQNVINKQLAAWAAIFAIATVFTGIWGMNFRLMPELQWDLGYPVALLIIIAVCGFLYLRFKRSDWL